MVIAVHEDDGLRGVHVAGLPEPTRRRLCAQPIPAPRLVGEVERVLGSAAPGPPATLAALPIAQGERMLGLLVLGRPSNHPLSTDDRTFLNVLTSLCALAMERLRMYADRSRVRAVLRRHETDPKPTRLAAPRR